MIDAFAAGSLQHLLALAGVAAAVVVAALAGRDPRTGRQVRRILRLGLALVLTGCYAAFAAHNLLVLRVPLRECLPLHLCDIVLLSAIIALIRQNQAAYEFTYFYGLGGTTQALLTPELASAFPAWECLAFFMVHGGILTAVAVLTFACGMRPRPGAWRWIIAAGYTYMALAGAANALLETNYGYLCAKPDDVSLLDYLGPWPWYLVSLQVIGIGMILALDRLTKLLHTPAWADHT